MPEPQKQEPKEKYYTLSFTREEILERIMILRNSENIALYEKVQKGREEADELNKLIQLIGDSE